MKTNKPIQTTAQVLEVIRALATQHNKLNDTVDKLLTFTVELSNQSATVVEALRARVKALEEAAAQEKKDEPMVKLVGGLK